MTGQMHLYGSQIQLEKREKMGDPLLKINKIINWEIFRDMLESTLRKPDYSKGGRPPWDVILMFKIVMLISWYNLSYNQAQYQANNRLDFMRFLGVEIGERLPDENTIWDLRLTIFTQVCQGITIMKNVSFIYHSFRRLAYDYQFYFLSAFRITSSFFEK